MPAIIPHTSDTLRRDRFEKWINKVKQTHKLRIVDILADIGTEAVDTLRKLTPKDTGAAAGAPTGKPMRASHPGRAYAKIGNDPGDTGWQLYHARNSLKFAIINPMWDSYLKFVNYTHPTQNNFVETAARQLKNRMKEIK